MRHSPEPINARRTCPPRRKPPRLHSTRSPTCRVSCLDCVIDTYGDAKYGPGTRVVSLNALWTNRPIVTNHAVLASAACRTTGAGASPDDGPTTAGGCYTVLLYFAGIGIGKVLKLRKNP
jgi:hypothetical protein